MRTLVTLLLLFAVVLSPVFAQTDAEETYAVNRANAMTWIEMVRNGHQPDLYRLLSADKYYMTHTPLAPAGMMVSLEEQIEGERALQSAFPDLQVRDYVVLTEGFSTAVLGIQEGTFVNSYAGLNPTQAYVSTPMLVITDYLDGHAIGDYFAWNQQAMMQGMGLAELNYTFNPQTLPVAVGRSDTSHSANHRLLLEFYASNSPHSGVTVNPYAEDAVIHDYLRDLDVQTALGLMARADALPERVGVVARIVCEGDLCASWARSRVTLEDGPISMMWAAVHRFEEGRVAEEWWLYDNATLWTLLPDWNVWMTSSSFDLISQPKAGPIDPLYIR